MSRSIRPTVDTLEERAMLSTVAAIHASLVHSRATAHVAHTPARHPFHLTSPTVTIPKEPLIPIVKPPTQVAPATTSNLSMTLKTDKSSYKAGEPVLITLKITNTASHAVQIADGPSLYDYSVTQNGTKVWDSRVGVAFPMFVVLETLKPGDSLIKTYQWNDQTSTDPVGTPNPPTTPQVVGTLQVHASFGQLAAPAVTITVR